MPDVSRETKEKLDSYYEILMHWNRTISLTEVLNKNDYYARHINDGLVLFDLLKSENKPIVDLGSGCGIPAIPLMILGLKITMVESVRKKSVFLNHVMKNFALSGSVLNQRVEEIFFEKPIIVIARALKPLNNLLEYMNSVSRETVGFFIKGERIDEEIDEAERNWSFSYQVYDGVIEGVVIRVDNVVRKM
ncbi:MAG: 16S rRNA (guanine(527)-N(7))-methyltransferase RsmG [Proteobacteria bacterium]|nr:16S rRNA (guanine(527)-N(7))-methyltransferase RsmG [Pseudomonadota bacterium]